MIRTAALALGLMVAISIGAVAQQNEPENISDAQSLCAKGYDAARQQGRLSGSGMSQYGKTEVDANKDGKISKSEFDQACAKNTFERQKKSTDP